MPTIADGGAPIPTRKVAEMLKLSPRRIRKLAKLHRIPGAVKVASHWVFLEPIEVLPPARPQGWPQGRRRG